eukprot:2022384-Rhodomonas_salina.1
MFEAEIACWCDQAKLRENDDQGVIAKLKEDAGAGDDQGVVANLREKQAEANDPLRDSEARFRENRGDQGVLSAMAHLESLERSIASASACPVLTWRDEHPECVLKCSTSPTPDHHPGHILARCPLAPALASDLVEGALRMISAPAHLAGAGPKEGGEVRMSEFETQPGTQELGMRELGDGVLSKPRPAARVEGVEKVVAVDASVGVFYQLVEGGSANADVKFLSKPAQEGGLWGDKCRIAQKEAREAKYSEQCTVPNIDIAHDAICQEEAGKLLRQLWEAKREKERTEKELVAERERTEKELVAEISQCKSEGAVMGSALPIALHVCYAFSGVWLDSFEEQVSVTSELLQHCHAVTDGLQRLKERALATEQELAAFKRKEGEREKQRDAEVEALKQKEEERERQRGEEASSLREVSGAHASCAHARRCLCTRAQ